MSAVLKSIEQENTIFQEIQFHSAWYGSVQGLAAEKLLRGRKIPYLYLIRAGENSGKSNEQNYYVSFLSEDLSVRHQPFVVTLGSDGWSYENGSPPGGPYLDASINDVLHLIMHCEQEECVPLVK